MPYLEKLAERLRAGGLAGDGGPLDGGLERAARLRLLDTALAWRASATTEVARPVGAAVYRLYGPAATRRRSAAARLVELAARGRSTEVDDIHLRSCTTPGSAICATVVALAPLAGSAGSERALRAVVAGYEAMTGAAEALGGPALLEAGIWPSRAVAPVAAAATAAALLALDAEASLQALTLAASWRCSGRMPEPARELSFGDAVLVGASAAIAAAGGARGDAAALAEWEAGGVAGRAAAGGGAGAQEIPERLPAVLETCVKAFCGARQTMAATSALLEIVEQQRLEPEAIEAVRIGLPGLHLRMVGRPGLPGERLEAISSMRYQVALALYRPDDLYDLVRRPLADRRLAELADRVELAADDALLERFPEQWGASVEVQTAGGFAGRRVEGARDEHSLDPELIRAKGERLFRRAGVPLTTLDQIEQLCAGFGRSAELDELWESGLAAPDSLGTDRPGAGSRGAGAEPSR